MFEAEPMVHPHVWDAYKKTIKVLKKHGIAFRVIGGIALNLRGVGRPTKDVDLIVSKKDWVRAIEALRDSISTDTQGMRFGLPSEPDHGLAIVGPHGVVVEIWPEGTTHEQIAKLRGAHRQHLAGQMTFTLAGDETVSLLNNKLASYLSATDRVSDAGDVQALIKRLELPLDFASRLAVPVRMAYRKLWKGQL